MSEKDRREMIRQIRRTQRRQLLGLRTWWLERMRQGRKPLLEKMTLFWHGHFATSIVKVKNPWLMWRQNQTLRDHALGNFGEMLRAMTRDGAMIRWLDLNGSRRGHPNENFAREVMELFTLGEGHYSEKDIQEAARAFTGHRIDPETGTFRFVPKIYDPGAKTFMGRTGNFNGDDIVEIILEQDQCAQFLAGRIWEFLAYADPEPAVLASAAAVFRKSGYEMQPLLRAIFASQAFYSPRAMRTQIKGPVDWLVNTCIVLGADLPSQPALDSILSRLGQLPFTPPNVRGWEGGKSWISSSTLILRYNAAAALAGSSDPEARRILNSRQRPAVDMGKVFPEPLRRRSDALAAELVFRIFGTPALPRMQDRALAMLAAIRPPVSDADLRGICQKLMSSPDYQLT